MNLLRSASARKCVSVQSTAAALITSLAMAATSQAVTVQFNDFSSTAGLTLNGNAIGNVNNGIDAGRVLRLTSSTVNQSGSAFSTTTVNAATFSTAFRFRITDPGGTIFDNNPTSGADGIVFVVQNVASNIGGAGQGIGYSGIPNSVGAEWDTWHNSYNNDPDSNHLGIDVNGVVDHGAGSPFTQTIATRFDDGNLWYAWVDYDGTNLEVRTNQTGIRPATATLSRSVNIVSILGATSAYIGFTSGTGADWGNHDIVSWEYRDSFDPIDDDHNGNPVPEPLTGGLVFLSGSAIVGYLSSRRQRTTA